MAPGGTYAWHGGLMLLPVHHSHNPLQLSGKHECFQDFCKPLKQINWTWVQLNWGNQIYSVFSRRTGTRAWGLWLSSEVWGMGQSWGLNLQDPMPSPGSVRNELEAPAGVCYRTDFLVAAENSTNELSCECLAGKTKSEFPPTNWLLQLSWLLIFISNLGIAYFRWLCSIRHKRLHDCLLCWASFRSSAHNKAPKSFV